MKDGFTVSGIGAAIAGAIGYFVGGFDVLIAVFGAVICIDTLSGMLKAWNLGEYNSKQFREGLIKKFGYIIGVLLVVQLDLMIRKVVGGTSIAFRDATLTFFIINEALSVIENLGGMGVQFPATFANTIKALRDKTENVEDKNSLNSH